MSMFPPSPTPRGSGPPPAPPTSDIVVVDTSARTHTGLNALEVATTIRAGLSMPRTSHIVDRQGESMGTCRLLSLRDDSHGLARLVALGGPCLAQLKPAVENLRLTRPVPLLIAVGDERLPGFEPRVGKEFIPLLTEALDFPLDLKSSRVFSRGRVSGAHAVEKAIELLKSGNADAAIVGGVDSAHDPEFLEWLDRNLRLHSMSTENGFIPGEAAAFLLLTTRRRSTNQRLAQIHGVSVQNEPRPYYLDNLVENSEPTHGLGMTLAIEAACKGLGVKGPHIGWILSDLVDERHRIDEWQLAEGRTGSWFDADRVHQRPTALTGDVGAASIPLLLSIACSYFQIGVVSAPQNTVLAAASSEGAERAAIVLSADVSIQTARLRQIS